MLYRSGERPGLLTPLGFGPHRGFESHSILQIWTSYRSGRTGRTLNPMACAHRRFESCLVLHHSRLYPNGRGSGSRSRTVLVRVEPDAPNTRAFTPVLNKLPCDAAGVATRLSTGREGIETPTGRHHRRQHWRAARSYKPGQRTAVDGRDRNPGRRPSTNGERRSPCEPIPHLS
jgi:hypothetical protein